MAVGIFKVWFAALECGYRHIDTAATYRNEETVGKILKEWFSSNKIRRDEVFVITKLTNYDFHPDKIEKAVETSLKKLQLDYVDLYLIHQPIYVELLEDLDKLDGKRPASSKPLPTDHVQCWKKLEEQVEAGYIKNLGLSNFNQKQIERIWQISKIKPCCLQIELSVFLQQPTLVNYYQNKGIIVTGYAMIGTNNNEGRESFNIFENETIKEIAVRYNVTVAHVAMRFFLEKNVIPINGSSNPKRIKDNLVIYNFKLCPDDIKALEGLNVGEKARARITGKNDPQFLNHPEYPYAKDNY